MSTWSGITAETPYRALRLELERKGGIVDARQLGRLLEGLASGAYAREMAARTQAGLERVRPLPASLDSEAEVMIHLASLWVVIDAGDALLVDREGGREHFRRWADACHASVRGFVREYQHLSPRCPLLPNLDKFLQDGPGHGNADRGLRTARAMASSGLGGGIRALRHQYFTWALKGRVMDLFSWSFWKLAGLEVEDRERCLATLARTVGTFHPHDAPATAMDVLCGWESKVREYIVMVTERAMPAELG